MNPSIDNPVSRFCGDSARSVQAFGVLFATMLVAFGLTSCASMSPYDEKPTVVLKSFQPMSGEGGVPGFQIGLGVINPSRSPLELHGVVYTISIEGQELVKGVGKDFPTVEPYSETTLTLNAQPNLLGGIRLLTGLVGNTSDAVNYEFEAKLDTGGWSVPIRVKEKGQFNLAGQSRE